MNSAASKLYTSLLRIFLKPKENCSLEEAVAWFRNMNVKNLRSIHVNFCELTEKQLG
jgi:hypothetical protein